MCHLYFVTLKCFSIYHNSNCQVLYHSFGTGLEVVIKYVRWPIGIIFNFFHCFSVYAELFFVSVNFFCFSFYAELSFRFHPLFSRISVYADLFSVFPLRRIIFFVSAKLFSTFLKLFYLLFQTVFFLHFETFCFCFLSLISINRPISLFRHCLMVLPDFQNSNSPLCNTISQKLL